MEGCVRSIAPADHRDLITVCVGGGKGTFAITLRCTEAAMNVRKRSGNEREYSTKQNSEIRGQTVGKSVGDKCRQLVSLLR